MRVYNFKQYKVGCPTIVEQPTLYANTSKFHLPHKTLFDTLCTNINPK